jgi:hypothetical protein
VVGDAHSVNDVVVVNDIANADDVLDVVNVGYAVGVAKGCAWTAELIQLVIWEQFVFISIKVPLRNIKLY